LTEYGLVAISDLVAGKLHSTELQGSFGYKINPALARYISDSITSKYWFLSIYPVEELLILGTPIFDTMRGFRQSFCMDSLSNAWFSVSDMDMLCADMFVGQYIFGTRDGNVCQAFTGYRDFVSSPPTSQDGSEVTGRMQGSFYDYGNNVMNKRMLRIKAYGFCDGPPALKVAYKAEYELRNLLDTPSTAIQPQSRWDQALWDVSIWDSGVGSFRKWIGVSGFGKKLSLQLAVKAQGRVLLTDFEVLYETGINL
jgi:hypothetical protein